MRAQAEQHNQEQKVGTDSAEKNPQPICHCRRCKSKDAKRKVSSDKSRKRYKNVIRRRYQESFEGKRARLIIAEERRRRFGLQISCVKKKS